LFSNVLSCHDEEWLAPRPSSWDTTTCRPSATAYSPYLPQIFISGGRAYKTYKTKIPCHQIKVHEIQSLTSMSWFLGEVEVFIFYFFKFRNPLCFSW